ncbi:hypothetical protein BSLG_005621 [Batrachochytrium salamandrivorans]|nr:hypothetical protein BSLG_005621 [Batrachochytrium salamandrivorans]
MFRTAQPNAILYGECGNDLSPAIKASLTLTDDNTCGRQVNKLPEFDPSPADFDYYREVRRNGLGGHMALAFDGDNLDSYDLRIGDVNDSGETALANFDKGHDGFPRLIYRSNRTSHNHEDVKNNHLGIRKIIEKYRKIGYKFTTVGESLRQPDPQSWYRVRDFNEIRLSLMHFYFGFYTIYRQL